MSDRKEASRQYYLAHREEIRAKHKAYMKAYREANKEQIRIQDQIYREDNRARINEYARIYYAENREHIAKQRKERRDDVKNTSPDWVFIVRHNEVVKFD